MKTKENSMKVQFKSMSVNEYFARVCVAAFAMQLDPTLDDLSDIKTAVSEAVTNSIIHGYEENEDSIIELECKIVENKIDIIVRDFGIGIKDIDKAREPLYTSKPEAERSGMGFTVMETFMDVITVESSADAGTVIHMSKTLER